MTESPYTFAEARAAAHQASLRQVEAERDRVRAVETAAAAELAYRTALARKIVELHAEGVAWSTTADIARGDKTVADLRMKRDVASGVKEAQEQAGFRLNADRRVLERLVEWSMRRELAEGGAS
jgi:multidrug resistance efflux pump